MEEKHLCIEKVLHKCTRPEARELSSSWLLATCGSLFSTWFIRLLFRFFRCDFLRSSLWLCFLLWLWSILGFNISIINVTLRISLIVVIVNMTTPSPVRHGHFTVFTSLIERLDSEIWAFHFRVGLVLTGETVRPTRNTCDVSRYHP